MTSCRSCSVLNPLEHASHTLKHVTRDEHLEDASREEDGLRIFFGRRRTEEELEEGFGVTQEAILQECCVQHVLVEI